MLPYRPTPVGGPCWGIKFLDRFQPDYLTSNRLFLEWAVKNSAFAAFHEAQFFTYGKTSNSPPDWLRLWSHALAINNISEIAVSINGWGAYPFPTSPSDPHIWPMMETLASYCDQHSVWLGATPIKTRWGIRLFDIRDRGLQDLLIAETLSLKSHCGVSLVYIDECHRTDTPCPNGQPLPEGWTEAMARILRRIGGAVINGTFETKSASEMILGRMFENAESRPQWGEAGQLLQTILDECDLLPMARRRLMIQTFDQSPFWPAFAGMVDCMISQSTTKWAGPFYPLRLNLDSPSEYPFGVEGTPKLEVDKSVVARSCGRHEILCNLQTMQAEIR